jgi:hypothetical protein
MTMSAHILGQSSTPTGVSVEVLDREEDLYFRNDPLQPVVLADFDSVDWLAAELTATLAHCRRAYGADL